MNRRNFIAGILPVAVLSSEQEKGVCAICVFFESNETKTHGVCRRFPPKVDVKKHDWCGEFKWKNS